MPPRLDPGRRIPYVQKALPTKAAPLPMHTHGYKYMVSDSSMHAQAMPKQYNHPEKDTVSDSSHNSYGFHSLAALLGMRELCEHSSRTNR